MEQGDIILGFLIPTDQGGTKPIHPSVGSFDNPTTRLGACLTFVFLALLLTLRNVCLVTKFPKDLPYFVIIIAFVHTQPLGLVRPGLGSGEGDALQGLLHQFHIRAVGAVHGQVGREAPACDQQAAFDAPLGAIGGIFPRLFPPRGAPWSDTRPCSTRTNRSLSSPPKPTSLRPTSSETPQLLPTLGSDHGRWSRDRNAWHPAPSTDSGCARQRKSPPDTADPTCAAARHRRDGCSHAAEAIPRSLATNPPGWTIPQQRPVPRYAGHPCRDPPWMHYPDVTSNPQGRYSEARVIRIGSK
jgi:hypothetical protein